MTEKFLLIGLDCAAPDLIFDDDRFRLPVLQGLMESGQYGVLRSCDPPITVPAWQVMATGKDPGALGCYGFRNRHANDYSPMRLATGQDIHHPRIWDRLGTAGIPSAILGVPQTFPPPSINGKLVSGPLTPDTNSTYTHPVALADSIRKSCGSYLIDVPNFRNADRNQLMQDLFALLDNRFKVARHLIKDPEWQFFMMVELGLDRLHHGFWRCADPRHPKFEKSHRYWDAFKRYYEAVDREIGEILRRVPEDSTVLIASDHGAKAIHGAIRMNQWLIDRGYLVLKAAHPVETPLDCTQVDWSQTRAWSAGGYYARVFLNVAGREPLGTVPSTEYDSLRNQLADEIRHIPGPSGEKLETVVHKPEALYADPQGFPPDLMVYFDDLRFRAAGTVGVEGIHANENDTGPDDANHAVEGMYILRNGSHAGLRIDADIMDITPTILDHFDLLDPTEFSGRSLLRSRDDA